MIKLDFYWNDKENRSRVKTLRGKLPTIFEGVEDHDLTLAWLKFSDGGWLDPSGKLIETFLAEIEIKKLRRGETELLSSYEDYEEDDEGEDYDNLFSGDIEFDDDEKGNC
jgi:hypothetical protein